MNPNKSSRIKIENGQNPSTRTKPLVRDKFSLSTRAFQHSLYLDIDSNSSQDSSLSFRNARSKPTPSIPSNLDFFKLFEACKSFEQLTKEVNQNFDCQNLVFDFLSTQLLEFSSKIKYPEFPLFFQLQGNSSVSNFQDSTEVCKLSLRCLRTIVSMASKFVSKTFTDSDLENSFNFEEVTPQVFNSLESVIVSYSYLFSLTQADIILHIKFFNELASILLPLTSTSALETKILTWGIFSLLEELHDYSKLDSQTLKKIIEFSSDVWAQSFACFNSDPSFLNSCFEILFSRTFKSNYLTIKFHPATFRKISTAGLETLLQKSLDSEQSKLSNELSLLIYTNTINLFTSSLRFAKLNGSAQLDFILSNRVILSALFSEHFKCTISIYPDSHKLLAESYICFVSALELLMNHHSPEFDFNSFSLSVFVGLFSNILSFSIELERDSLSSLLPTNSCLHSVVIMSLQAFHKWLSLIPDLFFTFSQQIPIVSTLNLILKRSIFAFLEHKDTFYKNNDTLVQSGLNHLNPDIGRAAVYQSALLLLSIVNKENVSVKQLVRSKKHEFAHSIVSPGISVFESDIGSLLSDFVDHTCKSLDPNYSFYFFDCCLSDAFIRLSFSLEFNSVLSNQKRRSSNSHFENTQLPKPGYLFDIHLKKLFSHIAFLSNDFENQPTFKTNSSYSSLTLSRINLCTILANSIFFVFDSFSKFDTLVSLQANLLENSIISDLQKTFESFMPIISCSLSSLKHSISNISFLNINTLSIFDDDFELSLRGWAFSRFDLSISSPCLVPYNDISDLFLSCFSVCSRILRCLSTACYMNEDRYQILSSASFPNLVSIFVFKSFEKLKLYDSVLFFLSTKHFESSLFSFCIENRGIEASHLLNNSFTTHNIQITTLENIFHILPLATQTFLADELALLISKKTLCHISWAYSDFPSTLLISLSLIPYVENHSKDYCLLLTKHAISVTRLLSKIWSLNCKPNHLKLFFRLFTNLDTIVNSQQSQKEIQDMELNKDLINDIRIHFVRSLAFPKYKRISKQDLGILFWVKFDKENGLNLQNKGEKTTLVHLHCPNDDFIRLCYNHKSFVVELEIRSNSLTHCVVSDSSSINIKDGLWHSIAVNFYHSKKMWGLSNTPSFKLFIDNKPQQSSSIGLVNDGCFSSLYVGSSPESLQNSDPKELNTENNYASFAKDSNFIDKNALSDCFSGFMSSVYILNEPVSEDLISLWNFLGPLYNFSLQQPNSSASNAERFNEQYEFSKIYKNLSQEEIDSVKISSESNDKTPCFSNACIDFHEYLRNNAISVLSPYNLSGDTNIIPDVSWFGIANLATYDDILKRSNTQFISNSKPPAAKSLVDSQLLFALELCHVFGVHQVKTTSVANCLSLLGGAEIFSYFPMVIHSDVLSKMYEVYKNKSVSALISKPSRSKPFATDIVSSLLTLTSISSILCTHSIIKSLESFSLLSSLLIQNHFCLNNNTSVQTISTIKKFECSFYYMGCSSKISQNSSLKFFQLLSSFSTNFVLNAAIWRKASYSVQLEYSKSILDGTRKQNFPISIPKNILKQIYLDASQPFSVASQWNFSILCVNNKALTSFVYKEPSIIWLLNTLRDYYSYESSLLYSLVKPKTKIPSSADPSIVIWSDLKQIGTESSKSNGKNRFYLSEHELKEIRASFLESLSILFGRSLQLESSDFTIPNSDIRALVQHLAYMSARDPNHTGEILLLIFNHLIYFESKAQKMVKSLVSEGIFEALCSIIQHDDQKLCAQSLILVVLLYNLASSSKNSLTFSKSLFIGKNSSSISEGDLSKILNIVKMKESLNIWLYFGILSFILGFNNSETLLKLMTVLNDNVELFEVRSDDKLFRLVYDLHSENQIFANSEAILVLLNLMLSKKTQKQVLLLALSGLNDLFDLQEDAIIQFNQNYINFINEVVKLINTFNPELVFGEFMSFSRLLTKAKKSELINDYYTVQRTISDSKLSQKVVFLDTKKKVAPSESKPALKMLESGYSDAVNSINPVNKSPLEESSHPCDSSSCDEIHNSNQPNSDPPSLGSFSILCSLELCANVSMSDSLGFSLAYRLQYSIILSLIKHVPLNENKLNQIFLALLKSDISNTDPILPTGISFISSTVICIIDLATEILSSRNSKKPYEKQFNSYSDIPAFFSNILDFCSLVKSWLFSFEKIRSFLFQKDKTLPPESSHENFEHISQNPFYSKYWCTLFPFVEIYNEFVFMLLNTNDAGFAQTDKSLFCKFLFDNFISELLVSSPENTILCLQGIIRLLQLHSLQVFSDDGFNEQEPLKLQNNLLSNCNPNTCYVYTHYYSMVGKLNDIFKQISKFLARGTLIDEGLNIPGSSSTITALPSNKTSTGANSSLPVEQNSISSDQLNNSLNESEQNIDALKPIHTSSEHNHLENKRAFSSYDCEVSKSASELLVAPTYFEDSLVNKDNVSHQSINLAKFYEEYCLYYSLILQNYLPFVTFKDPNFSSMLTLEMRDLGGFNLLEADSSIIILLITSPLWKELDSKFFVPKLKKYNETLSLSFVEFLEKVSKAFSQYNKLIEEIDLSENRNFHLIQNQLSKTFNELVSFESARLAWNTSLKVAISESVPSIAASLNSSKIIFNQNNLSHAISTARNTIYKILPSEFYFSKTNRKQNKNFLEPFTKKDSLHVFIQNEITPMIAGLLKRNKQYSACLRKYSSPRDIFFRDFLSWWSFDVLKYGFTEDKLTADVSQTLKKYYINGKWHFDTIQDGSRMVKRMVPNQHYINHDLAVTGRISYQHRSEDDISIQFSNPLTLNSPQKYPSEETQSKKEQPSSANNYIFESDPKFDKIGIKNHSHEQFYVIPQPKKLVKRIKCSRVMLLHEVFGYLDITETEIHWTVIHNYLGHPFIEFDKTLSDEKNSKSTFEHRLSTLTTSHSILSELDVDFKYKISQISEILIRSISYEVNSCEIFTSDRNSFLFHFEVKKDLEYVYNKLNEKSSSLNKITFYDACSPSSLLNLSNLTRRWQIGQLSNFDYLMALNTLAGRSFCDLAQYPVFPWIIQDYTSKELDLQNPAIFRDLNKPVGALNEERLAQFIERYNNFEDPNGSIPKFLYGTHYSSPATVAHFLIRNEPYTSVHILLQNGKIDQPDRQFSSIEESWKSCLISSWDVKELVPEFFYQPEFLVNHSDIDFGRKQNGQKVDDVLLPPWANGSPARFVELNRRALESEYVSENIQNWIDLIFGYKQVGEESVKSHNVFYYLSYRSEHSLNHLRNINDRHSSLTHIKYFGQTPCQLFNRPHPKRNKRIPLFRPISSDIKYFEQSIILLPAHKFNDQDLQLQRTSVSFSSKFPRISKLKTISIHTSSRDKTKVSNVTNLLFAFDSTGNCKTFLIDEIQNSETSGINIFLHDPENIIKTIDNPKSRISTFLRTKPVLVPFGNFLQEISFLSKRLSTCQPPLQIVHPFLYNIFFSSLGLNNGMAATKQTFTISESRFFASFYLPNCFTIASEQGPALTKAVFNNSPRRLEGEIDLVDNGFVEGYDDPEKSHLGNIELEEDKKNSISLHKTPSPDNPFDTQPGSKLYEVLALESNERELLGYDFFATSSDDDFTRNSLVLISKFALLYNLESHYSTFSMVYDKLVRNHLFGGKADVVKPKVGFSSFFNAKGLSSSLRKVNILQTKPLDDNRMKSASDMLVSRSVYRSIDQFKSFNEVRRKAQNACKVIFESRLFDNVFHYMSLFEKPDVLQKLKIKYSLEPALEQHDFTKRLSKIFTMQPSYSKISDSFFNKDISCYCFSNCGKMLILGFNDGSVYSLKITSNSVDPNNFEAPKLLNNKTAKSTNSENQKEKKSHSHHSSELEFVLGSQEINDFFVLSKTDLTRIFRQRVDSNAKYFANDDDDIEETESLEYNDSARSKKSDKSKSLVEKGEISFSILKSMIAHDSKVLSVSADYETDSLVSCSSDNTIIVSSLSKMEPIRTIRPRYDFRIKNKDALIGERVSNQESSCKNVVIEDSINQNHCLFTVNIGIPVFSSFIDTFCMESVESPLRVHILDSGYILVFVSVKNSYFPTNNKNQPGLDSFYLQTVNINGLVLNSSSIISGATQLTDWAISQTRYPQPIIPSTGSRLSLSLGPLQHNLSKEASVEDDVYSLAEFGDLGNQQTGARGLGFSKRELIACLFDNTLVIIIDINSLKEIGRFKLPLKGYSLSFGQTGSNSRSKLEKIHGKNLDLKFESSDILFVGCEESKIIALKF
ncbi:hypothetical protein BB560_005681 [Smittium megazygosporum]|uniref:Beige protein homolog 1 n=1 Tax=Smittium megazygosporum TaxID=133381 RepID=A0A2T9Z1E1_9FUNG|nr:hypothetical protein BB560_005681 [Smittium megazygosporum]